MDKLIPIEIILQSGKIILRKIEDDDFAALAMLANNKKIWDNVRDYFPFPYTEEDAKKFIEGTKNEFPLLTFAITYQNKFAGIMSLVPMQDVYKKSAEIGYWLGEPFWNKGIGTTAVELITIYGLEELLLHRIYAGIFEYNKASMKVLEKCGYKKEGVFKKSVFKNDQL